jgi:hypothetical protein
MSALPLSSVQRRLAETINKVKASSNNNTASVLAIAAKPIPTQVVNSAQPIKVATAVKAKEINVKSNNNNVPVKKIVKPAKKMTAQNLLDSEEEEELPVYTRVPREHHLDKDVVEELDSEADSEDFKDNEYCENPENDVEEDNEIVDGKHELTDEKAAEMYKKENDRIENRRARNPPKQFLQSLMAKYCSFDELEGQGIERIIPDQYRLKADEIEKIKATEVIEEPGVEEETSETSDEEDDEEEESGSEEEEQSQPLDNAPIVTNKNSNNNNNNNANAKTAIPKTIHNNNNQQKHSSSAIPAKIIASVTTPPFLAKVVKSLPATTIVKAPPATKAVPVKPLKPTTSAPPMQNKAEVAVAITNNNNNATELKLTTTSKQQAEQMRRSQRSTRYQGSWKDDAELPDTDSDDDDFEAKSSGGSEDDEEETSESIVSEEEESEEEEAEESSEEEKAKLPKKKAIKPAQTSIANNNNNTNNNSLQTVNPTKRKEPTAPTQKSGGSVSSTANALAKKLKITKPE